MAIPHAPDAPTAPLPGDASAPGTEGPWRDPSLPAEARVEDLMGRMTLEEKTAQLYGVWVGADGDGDGVAPHQNDMVAPVDWDTLITRGLGQLTRPFGTAPVDPATGAVALARAQRQITAANRFGIPALAHEECLAGFTAWSATAYPVPLAWGATFDPGLVAAMARRIGADLRAVGVHQGLAPVLDVVRDLRWGRVEETIGEDPYLVATVGTAYVRGLQSTGIVATLKHFAGYSASAGARNLAPVRAGARELADVILPPFEMALRDGGARSVMHSYAEIDGVPAAADTRLLTGLLRDSWGFTGTVVADYFGIGFLETLHKVAADPGDAARLALTAGVDVELPTVRSYGDALVDAVRDGTVPEAAVDRALRRVLLQKCELGLLDPDWSPLPDVLGGSDDPASVRGTVDLDAPANRATARLMAEQSCVLLANAGGALPLRDARRIAVVGPRADDPLAMLGCYSFPSHVGVSHPDVPLGVDIPTVLAALTDEFPDAAVRHAAGCDVDGPDTSGIADAVRLAADADVCVAVLGDRAGLFGRGTSGEGCDAADLSLPGVQARLLDALLATGTPVVAVLVTGRPYALGRWADRLAAVVQAFFPGEEGGPALAGVLSGRVNPSGRLPVGVPHGPGGQPWTYLQPPLGLAGGVSNLDPTPLYPFGHGLSYTTFAWEAGAAAPAGIPTDGSADVEVVVRNTGDRDGAEVVQLYLHDPVAQTTRPQAQLIGYARVPLAAGEAARVRFRFHTDLASFTGVGGRRIVEPGDLELRFAASSAPQDVRHTVRLRLTGPERGCGHGRVLHCDTEVAPVTA
ncbi:glycoside hydrolase family 3 N-terminal domain-containing protein [Streptomyces peucetius]|uniref:Glycoside hydrolase family 3 C-terminal domain-containing protein n=1 Tax=Streptomyces peucetius TaxID=1950 RepID=A0ABY6I402_STRPE|nr:glycoside hydrolase family 3 N-terminal domain-containing protein [Streptomyces peucetius]UYQ60490.1 glycoside hydrolase family 3 C-terminal domain-containing protein [Streptomyces peucetius]